MPGDSDKSSGMPPESPLVRGVATSSVLPMGVLSLDDLLLQLNSAMRTALGRVGHVGDSASELLGLQTLDEIQRAVTDGQWFGTCEVPVGDGTAGLHLSWSLLSGPADAPRWVMLMPAPVGASTPPATASHWRQVLSLAVDLSWTADETGAVLSITPGLTLGAGWTRDSMVGHRWLEFLHPEDRAVGLAVWERVLHGGRTDTEAFEARGGLGDGAWRWLRVTLTDLRSDAAIGAVVGTAVGITEVGAPPASSPLLPSGDAVGSAAGIDGSAVAFLAGDMGLVRDRGGDVTYVTPELAQVLGESVEDLVTSAPWDLIHPHDLPAVRDAYAQTAADGTVHRVDYRIQTRGGLWRCFQGRVAPFVSASFEGFVCSLRDITAQVEAENVVKSATALHDAIAAATEEGIFAVSTTGRTIYATERMASMLGLPLPDLYLHPPPMLDATNLTVGVHDVAYTRPDGAQRQLRAATSLLTAGDGTVTGTLVMVSDVTDTRRLDSYLRAASAQDELTGVRNRRTFLSEVELALGGGQRDVGLLFANVDGFRALNDSLGRPAGDAVLVALAERVRTAAGDGTTARVGSDEFAVLVVDAELPRMEELGRVVLASMNEPLTIDGVTVEVTAAVGVASARHATAEDLLHRADIAMRSAKSAGPGSLVAYDQEEADASEREDALGAYLQEALAHDDLVMHFQPVIDLTAGAVLGMEALARWTHPTLGSVEPARIVEAAERFGLSSELDRWAVRTALRAARALQRTGVISREAYVSVNLTAGHLTAAGLEDYIVSEVAAAGLAPAHLLLELTETAIMADTGLAVGMLRRLRTRGFRVAIDDFGTGYSSLAYLRDLPVSMLKIDRSFVAEIRSDSDALAIVASIIDLARAIGVTAVAKGAETMDQAGLLRELGCKCAQGWLWSPALSVEDISASRAWARPFDVGARQVQVAPVRRERFPVGPEHGLDRMLAMHAKGASLSTIAASLNADGYFTPKGLRWHGTSVARAVADAAFVRRASSTEQPYRG